MSPSHRALVARYLPDPAAEDGEAALLPALMRWLVATGRLRAQTSVAYEVPWLGRRVDLALLTGRGIATAFELKIGRLQRVLEQAAYNRSSFHRSWIVTGNRPRPEGLRWVTELGVGLLVVQQDVVVPMAVPELRRPHPAAVERLRGAILDRATTGA